MMNNSETTNLRPVTCPRCERAMRSDLVKTVMWYDERVVLVENIPALVCDACMDQFYDDETTEALTRLTEEGFPLVEQTGEILVPVFTLKRRTPPNEDEVVWPVGSA